MDKALIECIAERIKNEIEDRHGVVDCNDLETWIKEAVKQYRKIVIADKLWLSEIPKRR